MLLHSHLHDIVSSPSEKHDKKKRMVGDGRVGIVSIIPMGCVGSLKGFFLSELRSSNVQLILNEILCKWSLPSEVSCQ